MRYYVGKKDAMQDLFDNLGGIYIFYYEIDEDTNSFEKYYHREMITKRLKYIGTATQELFEGLERVVGDIVDLPTAFSIDFIQNKNQSHLFHYSITFAYDDDYIYGVFDCDDHVAVCIFDSLEEALCFIPQPYEKNSVLQMHSGDEAYEALYVENHKVRLQRSEYKDGKCVFFAMEDVMLNTFNEWLRQKVMNSIEWEEF